jgi:hypothetical protein
VFGTTLLDIFVPIKYAKMMNFAKKEALAANNEEAKQIQKGPTIKYAASSPWTSVEDYPDLEKIFDLKSHIYHRFVFRFMTVFKPRENDCEGWIYVYERDSDRNKLQQGQIKDIILYKVGRTVRTPLSRVGLQEQANGENYNVIESFKSKYHKFVEYAIHWMFAESRVVNTDSIDGKTEWFLIDRASLMEGIKKVRRSMTLMHKDF